MIQFAAKGERLAFYIVFIFSNSEQCQTLCRFSLLETSSIYLLGVSILLGMTVTVLVYLCHLLERRKIASCQIPSMRPDFPKVWHSGTLPVIDIKALVWCQLWLEGISRFVKSEMGVCKCTLWAKGAESRWTSPPLCLYHICHS